MNNLEFKNIKIDLKHSQETIRFTADVYVDGKMIGFVDNNGEGGAHGHSNRDVAIAIRAAAKVNHADYNDGFVDYAIGREIQRQELKKQLKSGNILYTKAGENGLFVGKPNAVDKKVWWEQVVADKGIAAKLVSMLKSQHILNLLPFETALDIFIEENRKTSELVADGKISFEALHPQFNA